MLRIFSARYENLHFFPLGHAFSIYIPLTSHFYISVQALAPKLNPSSLSASVCRLMTLPCPLSNEHAIRQHSQLEMLTPSQSSLACQKRTTYKVRVAFSKPVHVARTRIGPPSANHGPFKAKPSSCHVHSTPEPACQHAETIFSEQCAV